MLFDRQFFSRIQGFLAHQEGVVLYDLAREISAKAPCLEIGSYCGRSSVYIGLGCQANNAILFSIDHHRGSEEHQPGEAYFNPSLYNQDSRQVDTLPHFRKTIQMAGLEETVVPIVSSSQVVAKQWKTPLSMVFIDGGHSFESAFTDYRMWSVFIIPEGYLLIHDLFEDPDQGGQAPYQVYQKALSSGKFEAMPTVSTLGILKRRP
jgi:predicted O-methyltransferase YrrM